MTFHSGGIRRAVDRKSTRLNSSHLGISYAVPRGLHSFPTRRSSDLPVDTEEVFGVLHEPDQPSGVSIALTHGAGSNFEAPLLIRLAQAFAAAGCTVLRYDLPFRRNQKGGRSEEHTSELQSLRHIVCRPTRSPLFPYTTLFRSSR